MSLIKCPECGKEISNKGTACVHCGCPMEEILKTGIVSASKPSTDKNHDEIEKFNTLGDDLRTEKKYLTAFDYYTKAAELGSSHAQLWLGNFYDRGLGVDQDYKKAAEWYQKAADLGNADALGNLALLYKNGNGVNADINKAIELNIQAIQKGNAVAAGNLGMLYEFAPNEIQSYTLARKYYEIAISLGTTEYPIYNNLAHIYEEGKDVSVDYAKAEQYYLMAIKLGSKNAKISYGVFANNRGVEYADGKGVQKNYAKAEAYYLEAIKYGNLQAQNNYDALKKVMGTINHSTSAPSLQNKDPKRKGMGIFIAIVVILILVLIGISNGGNDDGERTCAWCNGTGYSGNGAQSVEDYVFKKTPCTHCGGDGKY